MSRIVLKFCMHMCMDMCMHLPRSASYWRFLSFTARSRALQVLVNRMNTT
jgi:hypothetical protein